MCILFHANLDIHRHTMNVRGELFPFPFPPSKYSTYNIIRASLKYTFLVPHRVTSLGTGAYASAAKGVSTLLNESNVSTPVFADSTDAIHKT